MRRQMLLRKGKPRISILAYKTDLERVRSDPRTAKPLGGTRSPRILRRLVSSFHADGTKTHSFIQFVGEDGRVLDFSGAITHLGAANPK